MAQYHSASGSVAEDLFIDLFTDTFGAEKAGYLYSQYHFYDIYQNSRYADFVLENGARRVAIEIDDETSHNKSLVASNKFCEYWSYERTIDTIVLNRDFGIPVCSIEKEYVNAASGQLRTRFQAFIESVEIKKIQEGVKR